MMSDTIKQFDDGLWQYIDYVPLEQSIVVETVKTRYADGMVWFDKHEMASILGWEVRDTRRYLDEKESKGELTQEHVAVFEDKTRAGRKFKTKCYSAKIFQQLCGASKIEGDQHKMWVLSKSGLDDNNDYERHMLALMNKNDEIESKYKYNILDFLWYHGEKVREAGGYSDGYFVLFYYMLFSILPVALLSPHFLPVTIAFVLILALVCVLLLASRQRRWAIKVHYGLNYEIYNIKFKRFFSFDGIFMTVHILSWFAWWWLLALLLKRCYFG